MKILVCGGRDYTNERRVFEVLGRYLDDVDVIIHGRANGADSIANCWALLHNILVKAYPADWGRFGRAAGPKRNKQMLDEGKPDLVIAFPGGKGTANMISQSKKHHIKVIEIEE